MGVCRNFQIINQKEQYMKGRLVLNRLMLFIPLVVFLTLAACEGVPTQDAVTSALQTIAAASITPTPINTPHPSEKTLVDLINGILLTSGDPLETTLDAAYIVDKVVFLPDEGGLTLSIEVHCDCPRNTACCTVEHAFVVISNAMRVNGVYLINLIPPGVNEFQISCNDHQSPLGTMFVPWPYMQNYIMGTSNGYQLGGEVMQSQTP
jgi:hypothetical protein